MATIRTYIGALRKPGLFWILPASFDTSWIESLPGGGGGGGGGIQLVQNLSSFCNGINQGFTLGAVPSGADKIQLFWNGIGMTLNAASGFTVAGTNLHTNFVPQAGDHLVAYIF